MPDHRVEANAVKNVEVMPIVQLVAIPVNSVVGGLIREEKFVVTKFLDCSAP